MALQVWLPLNGTFENKGIQDITVTASGSATFATGGKISEQALQGNGSTYWSINPITLGSEASICCWSKTATNGKMMWVLEATSYSSLNLYASSVYSLNVGNGSTNAFKDNNNNTITVFNDNKWHHFVVTFGNNQSKLYIDGDYKGMAPTFKNPTTTTSKKIKIGGGFSNGHTYDWNGMINDFRVYDHCLSPLEVKEIAQGLILHYKMDDNSNTNWLLPNLEKTVTRASSNTFIDYSYYSDLISHDETEYIVDFYAKGSTSNIKMDVYFRNSSGSAYALTTTQTVTTDWKHYSLSLSGSPNTLEIFRVRCYSGTAGSILYIKDMKLFSSHMPIRDSVTTDSSGYGHYGTIVGNIQTVIDNKSRYNKCIYIPSGNTDYLETINTIGNPEDSLTINLWFKSQSTSGGAGYHSLISPIDSEPRKIEFAIYCSNGYFRQGIRVNGTRYVTNYSPNILDNNWHMVTMTYDGINVKRYIDAVLKGTVAAEGVLEAKNNRFRIGRFGNSEGFYSVESYFSDIRVYATALDENAIKNLYNIGMKIDNLNNIHTFEYKEQNNTNIKLYKIGQLLTDEINEISGNTQFKKTGQIYAPEFIEK